MRSMSIRDMQISKSKKKNYCHPPLPNPGDAPDILIVQPSFSLVSAEFQPNFRRMNLANLLLKLDQN